MIPSDEPCPKCGSGDIACKWFGVDDYILPPYVDFYRDGVGCWWVDDKKVTEEHMYHHCRCCGFQWIGDVLGGEE